MGQTHYAHIVNSAKSEKLWRGMITCLLWLRLFGDDAGTSVKRLRTLTPEGRRVLKVRIRNLNISGRE